MGLWPFNLSDKEDAHVWRCERRAMRHEQTAAHCIIEVRSLQIPTTLLWRCAMYTKIWVMSVILVGLLGSVWFSSSHASEGKAPSPEAAKNIGPVRVKAYTFAPVRPNLPDHLCLHECNG